MPDNPPLQFETADAGVDLEHLRLKILAAAGYQGNIFTDKLRASRFFRVN